MPPARNPYFNVDDQRMQDKLQRQKQLLFRSAKPLQVELANSTLKLGVRGGYPPPGRGVSIYFAHTGTQFQCDTLYVTVAKLMME